LRAAIRTRSRAWEQSLGGLAGLIGEARCASSKWLGALAQSLCSGPNTTWTDAILTLVTGGDEGADFRFDRIGYWSEIKLEIIRKYATAYSTIMSNQPSLRHVYIDGFAGAGEHWSRESHTVVPGSPGVALEVVPPFREFFFIDLDGDKVERLLELCGSRADVRIHQGDCNQILLEEVFPRVRWEDYRRGLCLLDPYGLNLRWEVIRGAGALRTIDLFLNFPIMDANRNVLWRDPGRVSPSQAARLTAFWGDESWRGTLYHPDPQGNLFGDEALVKADNEDVAEAFRRRLRDVAGFSNVPKPMAMRNKQGAVVYYLFFASQKAVANNIVEDIFEKYADRRD
jgi:three-Cys-motif partner protein